MEELQADPQGPSISIPGPAISTQKKAKMVRNTLSDFSGWWTNLSLDEEKKLISSLEYLTLDCFVLYCVVHD